MENFSLRMSDKNEILELNVFNHDGDILRGATIDEFKEFCIGAVSTILHDDPKFLDRLNRLTFGMLSKSRLL